MLTIIIYKFQESEFESYLFPKITSNGAVKIVTTKIDENAINTLVVLVLIMALIRDIL